MSQTPEREKLYVRFSTSQDVEAVRNFYQNNQHQFVFQREPDVVKERVESGAVTIIEDSKGAIVASSISYPIVVKDGEGNDNHMWTEIGSTRIALEGAGVFKALISAQILRAFLLEPPEDRFVLEIVKSNARSTNVFQKLGSLPFEVPEELTKVVQQTITPDCQGAEVTWYQFGPETVPDLAKNIVECMCNPVLKNKLTGQEYEIDFSKCPLKTLFADAVNDLAGETPDKKFPLASIKMLRNKFGL